MIISWREKKLERGSGGENGESKSKEKISKWETKWSEKIERQNTERE